MISEKMNKYISVSKDGIEKLRSTFKIRGEKIGARCVKDALTFRHNSDLARKIRKVAINEYGGRLMVDGVQEDGTWFTGTPGCPESPHMMHMALPNEVIIEVHTSDGHVDVIKDEEVVRSYQNVKVADLTAIREVALSL